MKRPVLWALAGAALLLGACIPCFFIMVGTDSGSEGNAGRGTPGSEMGSGAGGAAFAPTGSSSLGVRSARGAPDTEGVSSPPGGEEGFSDATVASAGGRGSGRPGRRTQGAGSTADGAPSEGEEPGGETAESGSLLQGDLLTGDRLTQALSEALESEDLGPLQGLLISGLTEDGTRFTVEDVPALFEALVGVDDFGMEKLILTHLERTDALPEDKVNGYLDYLESAKRPHHVEDVFQQLVKMGGDASFEGLSEVLREPSLDRYRSRAAQALGDLKDPRAVSLLDRALYAVEDPRMARPYVDALGRLGGVEAYGSMVTYISREGNEATVSAIYRIRDQELAPFLAESLNDRSSDAYQRAALLKLRTTPDPRTLDDLARFLGRTEGPRQREAIEAVGRIYDPAAIRVLENFARQQSDPKLAAQALRAASRVRTRLERPPADRTQGRREQERPSRRSA